MFKVIFDTRATKPFCHLNKNQIFLIIMHNNKIGLFPGREFPIKITQNLHHFHKLQILKYVNSVKNKKNLATASRN
jgi:hypothetical protein